MRVCEWVCVCLRVCYCVNVCVVCVSFCEFCGRERVLCVWCV